MVKRGADDGGDYHLPLVMVKLQLKKAEKLKDGTKFIYRFNITHLEEKKFTTLLKNRFQVLGDIGKELTNTPVRTSGKASGKFYRRQQHSIRC